VRDGKFRPRALFGWSWRRVHLTHAGILGGSIMKWTKPEAEVVAVTMEVTAYVATL